MNAKKKLPLIVLGCGAALILAVVVFALTFDINSYRPRIKAAASEVIGLSVSIDGKMGLSFYPFGIAAKDIHVTGKGGEILSLEDLRLGVEIMPLLKRQLTVTSCELVKPVVTIVKDPNGKYNYESTEEKSTKGKPGTAFRLHDLKLTEGVFVYLDKKSGEKTEFKDFTMSVKDLSIAGNGIKNASFAGSLDCKEVIRKDFKLENLKAPVKAVKGIYNFSPLTIDTLVYVDMKTEEKTEFKNLTMTINDLAVWDTSGHMTKDLSFTGNLGCKEVLQKDFRIENLKAPVKAVKGMYNFEPLTIGALSYFDKKAGEKTELQEINLAIKDLSLADAPGAVIKNISFAGVLDCREVRKKDLDIGNVKSPIRVEKGVIHMTSLSMDIFGAKAEGDVIADKSEADAVYKINLRVAKLDFEKLEGSFGAKKSIGGKGDLDASLTMTEKGHRNFMSGIDGTLSLRGDNLILYTMDLDKFLSSYDTSQNVNLVDVAAFFIAGPLSTVALKGYRYGDVYSKAQGGRGTITKFSSHWKINAGMADATDCALATRHNRIALKGRLNLVGERYENVIVALLNDKGCVKVKQGINGPFGNPQIGAVSAVESLGSPIFNLYRKTKSFIEGGRCEVFYNGSVPQPPK